MQSVVALFWDRYCFSILLYYICINFKYFRTYFHLLPNGRGTHIFQILIFLSFLWKYVIYYNRYFGITQLFVWDCQNPGIISTLDVEWASFVNPVALYLLYYTMILETKVLLKPQVSFK